MKRPARILLTNMYGGIGGGEVCLLHHIRHLQARGCHVTLLLLEGGQFEAEARNAGAEVLVRPFAWQGGRLRSALALLRSVVAAWQLIRRCRPEVICSYTFNDFVIAGTAARLAGVPIVWRTQGEVVPERLEVGANWLGSSLARFSRFVRPHIASTTQAEADALARLAPGARSIACVHLGTPEQGAAPPTGNARVRFGLFGRLVAWKGQHVFLHALGILRQRGMIFDAWIVGGSSFGDGEAYEAQLRASIEAKDLAGHVSLLGHRSDVATLMGQCDVLCHCSAFEPFGMVIIEAMMLGRPVVASDVRGPRESVEPGVTGLLVPPGNPAALADALATLLADPALRAAMGQAGHARARALFGLDARMRHLDAVLSLAAARETPRA